MQTEIFARGVSDDEEIQKMIEKTNEPKKPKAKKQVTKPKQPKKQKVKNKKPGDFPELNDPKFTPTEMQSTFNGKTVAIIHFKQSKKSNKADTSTENIKSQKKRKSSKEGSTKSKKLKT